MYAVSISFWKKFELNWSLPIIELKNTQIRFFAKSYRKLYNFTFPIEGERFTTILSKTSGFNISNQFFFSAT